MGGRSTVRVRPRPDGTMKIGDVEFSKIELDRIQRCAQDVWQVIGGDCIQAFADDKGKDPEEVVVRKHVVIELVCDAGRLEEQIKRKDPALAEKVRRVEGTAIYDAVRPAFPYSSYGL